MDSASSAAIDALQRRVASALGKHELRGKRLLVAVSGGPDSLALLHALWQLRDEHELRLYGAHLNHGLRGAESDADAEFTADTFKRLEIPFTLDSADVAAYRTQHKLSLEDAARQVRYAFLDVAATKHAADVITLGHTADDQAETVLMHIIRGSGLDGLRGMQSLDTRRIAGKPATLFRPLLGARRSETQAYCRALGLSPRIDASNRSPEFLRNHIRMELVPLLEQTNPSIHAALLRLAANATQDSDYIRAKADEVWNQVAHVHSDGAVRLDTRALRNHYAALQSHTLRRAIEVAGGELSQQHVLDIMALIGGAPAKTLHLSNGLTFVTGYGEAHIGRAATIAAMLSPLPALHGEHPIAAPGKTQVGGWHVRVSFETDITKPDRKNFSQERCDEKSMRQDSFSVSEALDLDSVGETLRLRARLPGDRFQPLGMDQSKSLREFMIDVRIPRQWRDGLPLVVSERGIVCVPGWRIAHWARVTDTTQRIMRLSLSYGDEQD